MVPRGRSRFFSNTVALALQMTFATVITLVQVKLLSNHLTQSDFGLFASLRGLSLLLSMVAANGIPQLLVRFLPAHEASGNSAGARRLSALSLLVSSVLGVLLCAAVHVLRGRVFGFSATPLESAFYLWFYATTLGVTLKMVLYGGLNGARRLVVQSVIEVASLAATLTWIWIIRDDLNLTSLFRILGVVQLASVAVSLPFFFAALSPSRHDGLEPARAGHASYWMWATALSVVALAFTDVDRYLLAHVLTFEALALFHIAARVARLAHRLLGVANLSLQPELSRLDAESRTASISAATGIFMKFNAVASVVIAAGVVVFARDIIVLITSGDYLAATPLLIILAVGLPLTSMTAPLTTAMKATDHVRAALWVDLAWACAYVPLIFVLGRAFELGGVGAAHVVAGLVQLLLALRLSRLGFEPRFVSSLVAKIATAAVLAFAPAIVLAGLGDGWLLFAGRVLAYGLGCVLFLVVTRGLRLFSSTERVAVGQLFESRGLKPAARLF